jgi:predicted RNase H-like HicB family nuclease
MNLSIELEREVNGRWIAGIPPLPGAMVCGRTREAALAQVTALARRVLADRLEHGGSVPERADVFSVAA